MSGSSLFYMYTSYGNKIQDAKSKCQLSILFYNRPKYYVVSFNHEKQVIRETLEQTILDSNHRYCMRQIFTLLITYHGFHQFNNLDTKSSDFFESFPVDFYRLVIIFPTSNKSQLTSFTICFHSHESKIMFTNLICAHYRHPIELISFYSLSFQSSNVVNLFVNNKPVLKHKMAEIQSVNLNLKILGEIISSTNFTITKPDSGWPYETKFNVFSILINPPLIPDMLGFQDYRSYISEIIHLYSLEVKYLTCYRSHPFLELNLFLSPFAPELWVTLGFTVSLISSVIYVYVRWKYKSSIKFSPFFYFVSTLTEDSYTVPETLTKDFRFNMVTGIWRLFTVIFTSSFSSLVILKLNAPLSGEKYEYFDSLFCNKYNPDNLLEEVNNIMFFWYRNFSYASISRDLMGRDDNALRNEAFDGFTIVNSYGTHNNVPIDFHSHLKKFTDEKCFSFFSRPIVSFVNHQRVNIQNPFRYEIFNHIYDLNRFVSRFPSTFISNPKFNKRAAMISFISPRHRHYPRDLDNNAALFNRTMSLSAASKIDILIERELTTCERSVFVGYEEDVSAEFEYLTKTYPNLQFYRGKDSLTSSTIQLEFLGFAKSRILKYISAFFETGLYGFLRKNHTLSQYSKRIIGTRLLHGNEVAQKTDSVKALRMSSSLQALFILCLAFIMIATIQLVLERLIVIMLTCNFKLKYSQLRQLIRKGFTRKMKFRQVNRRVRLKRKLVRGRFEVTRSMLR